jgi:hypothetical protein
MNKILIGMTAATLWLVFSQAANAERVCRETCDGGTCVSRCVNQDEDTIIRDRDRDRDRDYDRRPDRERGPGVELRVPGVGVVIGR